MLPYLIGLGFVALALYALKSAIRGGPDALKAYLRQMIGAALVAIAIGLLSKGSYTNATILGAVGLYLQFGPAWTWPPGFARKGETFTTAHLEGTRDPKTGALRGRVLKGFFSGRAIERLRPVELAHLWQDCRLTDPQTAGLVEAHLNRLHPTWRDELARAEAEAPKGPDGKMTRAEAFEILGLQPGAGEDEIRKAHRALMLRLHPDRGGSNYLAAKINEAKDVALR